MSCAVLSLPAGARYRTEHVGESVTATKYGCIGEYRKILGRWAGSREPSEDEGEFQVDHQLLKSHKFLRVQRPRKLSESLGHLISPLKEAAKKAKGLENYSKTTVA